MPLDTTQTHQVSFSPYMAPEMYQDDECTTAADVFSFGLILYEMLVGHPVFPPTLSPFAVMKKVMGGERAEIPRTMKEPIQ